MKEVEKLIDDYRSLSEEERDEFEYTCLLGNIGHYQSALGVCYAREWARRNKLLTKETSIQLDVLERIFTKQAQRAER